MLWKINKIKRDRQNHKHTLISCKFCSSMHRAVWYMQANIKIWSRVYMIMTLKDIDQTTINVWCLKIYD